MAAQRVRRNTHSSIHCSDGADDCSDRAGGRMMTALEGTNVPLLLLIDTDFIDTGRYHRMTRTEYNFVDA